MNSKEITQFKNILRDYLFYEKEIKELGTEINYLYEIASGYSGVKISTIKYAKNDQKIYNILERIEKLSKKKMAYEYMVNYADNILEKMTETNRKAIKDIYVYGLMYEKVAAEMNYSSAGMYKSIHGELKKINA